jgi:hypothetical protein
MTQTDAALRARLDEAVPPFADGGDWTDVLRRAEVAGLGPSSPRVRAATVAVAAMIAAVALLTTPALGLGDRLRAFVGADSAEVFTLFRARLSSPDGARTGTFTVRVASLGVHRPGSGRLRLFKGPLRWTLVLRGIETPPAAAHLHLGDRRYTLCAPCTPARTTGTLTRAVLDVLHSERAIVDVHTGRGAGAALRGRVERRLRRPG